MSGMMISMKIAPTMGSGLIRGAHTSEPWYNSFLFLFSEINVLLLPNWKIPLHSTRGETHCSLSLAVYVCSVHIHMNTHMGAHLCVSVHACMFMFRDPNWCQVSFLISLTLFIGAGSLVTLRTRQYGDSIWRPACLRTPGAHVSPYWVWDYL